MKKAEPLKTREAVMCLSVISISFLLFYVSAAPFTLAAPPEGKGSDRAHEVASNNGNGHSNSSAHVKSEGPNAAKHADRMLSRQMGGRNFYAKGAGDYGLREAPVPSSEELSNKKQSRMNGKENSMKVRESLVVKDFEQALGKLRKFEHARWAHNPKDTRGQGNMGKVNMLDPYGFAKDDRMDLYGNRGRVIRVVEEPPPPEPTQQISITGETYEILRYAEWYGAETTTQLLTITLGYTYEEAIFLQALNLDALLAAVDIGYVIWTP